MLMREGLALGEKQRNLKKGKEISKGRSCQMIDERRENKDLGVGEPEESSAGDRELLLSRNEEGAAVSNCIVNGPMEGPAGQRRQVQGLVVHYKRVKGRVVGEEMP